MIKDVMSFNLSIICIFVQIYAIISINIENIECKFYNYKKYIL